MHCATLDSLTSSISTPLNPGPVVKLRASNTPSSATSGTQQGDRVTPSSPPPHSTKRVESKSFQNLNLSLRSICSFRDFGVAPTYFRPLGPWYITSGPSLYARPSSRNLHGRKLHGAGDRLPLQTHPVVDDLRTGALSICSPSRASSCIPRQCKLILQGTANGAEMRGPHLIVPLPPPFCAPPFGASLP